MYLLDMVSHVRGILADDATASHCCDFVSEPYEKKQFLPTLMSREDCFAPSWGDGGNDHSDPCTKRGRQQKWFKDFWPLQSQRLWRLWPFRAVRTVLHYRLLRTRPNYRRPHWVAQFTSYLSRGQAFRSVRHTSFIMGCV